MRKTILLVLLFIGSLTYYQENHKAKDLFSIKAGLIGGWVSFEKAISENFTINTEIGYEGGFLKGTDNKVDYIFTSIISAEPRYYYNFNKRIEKGKKTLNNSANYLSAELFYIPDLLTSSNRTNVTVNKSFGIIPKWGLRRSLSEKLNFEFALGIGYAWGENNINGLTSTLDLRFGYSF